MSRHDAEITRLAEEYRSLGFEVKRSVRVGTHELDLLAVRGSERVAVEVLGGTSAGTKSKRIGELSDEVSREGWTFRLVVLPIEVQDFDYGTADPAPIGARLQRARSLAATDPEAALLLAWSMFEAAARRALVREAAAANTLNPNSLAKQLVHHGLLGNEDLDELLSIAGRRNAVAHGVPAVGVSANDVAHLADWGHELLKVA